MKKPLIMLMLLVSHGAMAQGRLPPCSGASSTDWTNCSGQLVSPNGDRYVGDFLNGAFDGQGSYSWTTGDRYVGEFRNGVRSGQGTLTSSSGDRYVGQFKDDQFHGQGTLTLPNGTEYVGEFRDGGRNGPGTEYRADGTVLKSGMWQE